MRRLLRVKPAPRGAGARADASLARVIYCPPSDLTQVVACAERILREALTKHGAEDDPDDVLASDAVPISPDSAEAMPLAGPAATSEPAEALPAAPAASGAPRPPEVAASAMSGSSFDECDVSIAWPASGSHGQGGSARSGAASSRGRRTANDLDCGSPPWPPGMELQAFLDLQEQLQLLEAQQP